MNYKKALNDESELTPQGAVGFFAFPVMWLVVAFVVLTIAGLAGNL
jgi:hypothetical protein